MSENGTDSPAEDQRPDQGAGVLGNLPHSRPAVRSPRRAAPVPDADPDPKAEAASAAAHRAPANRGGSSTEELEALARTGLAIAGGAASLGLRLAGRAAAALRGAVDRS